MTWAPARPHHNLLGRVVSFEVFKRSPQPLKAGIVATAAFNRFLEFSMYSQRCMSAGSVVACSACDLIPPAASPYLSPCTLAKPQGRRGKEEDIMQAGRRQGGQPREERGKTHIPRWTRGRATDLSAQHLPSECELDAVRVMESVPH